MSRVGTMSTIMLLVAAGAGGCATKRQVTVSATAPPPVVEPAPPAPPRTQSIPVVADGRSLTEEELFARKSLDELNAEQPLAQVFFDYDSAAIRDDAREVLQQNAKWLMRWGSTRVFVEGHSDERGTAEYNLALGDRRAAAVHDYLASLGVPGARVTVVSKGKEVPVCTDASEQCWRRNRRGAFVLTAK